MNPEVKEMHQLDTMQGMRKNRARLHERQKAVLRQHYGTDWEEEDVGDINYRSPTNIDQHYYPKQQGGSGLLKLIAPLLIATGVGGGLAGAGWMVAEALKQRPVPQQSTTVNNPAPQQQAPAEDADTIFQLRLAD